MNVKDLIQRTLFRAKVSSAQFIVNKLNVPRPFSVNAATLDYEEEQGLKQLLYEANQQEGPVIEIGTLIGATTMKMAIWAPSKTIITVDNYIWNAWNMSSQDHFDLTTHSLYGLVQQGRIQQVNMDKSKFYQTYSDIAPSLVFLDAMHTYEETRKDIQWAKEVGARIIAGHDYCDLWPGVIQAVEEAGGAKQLFGSVWRL